MAGNRVIVLGLDGFSQILLGTGAFEYLSELYREGPSGPLESTIPASTPPAWASFQTGHTVGNHGVSGFLRFDGLRKTVPRDSSDIPYPTFYEVLDAHGFRCFIMNMPYTYPPRIKGDIVFSWLSGLKDIRRAVRPRSLLDEFPSLRHYRLFPEHRPTIKGTLENMLAFTRAQVEVIKEVFTKGQYDFMFFMLPVTDWIQHMKLPLKMVEGEGSEEVRLAQEIAREVDGLVGFLDNSISRRDALIIMSDHGFTYCEKAFSINDWLAQEGYIRLSPKGEDALDRSLHPIIRGSPAKRTIRLGLLANLLLTTPLGRLLRPVAGKLASLALALAGFLNVNIVSGCRIDEASSRAYCLEHSEFGIYVNRRLPQEERDEIREELLRKLSRLKGIRAYDTRSIYRGGRMVDLLPDVYLMPGEWAVVKGMAGTPILDMPMMVHDLYGILILRGEFFEGEPENARIIDLAPTILYLMGLPVPDGLDGRPLLECLNEGLIGPPGPSERARVRLRAREVAKKWMMREGP